MAPAIVVKCQTAVGNRAWGFSTLFTNGLCFCWLRDTIMGALYQSQLHGTGLETQSRQASRRYEQCSEEFPGVERECTAPISHS